MICKNCGNEISANAKFCGICGTSAKASDTSPEQAITEVLSESIPNQCNTAVSSVQVVETPLAESPVNEQKTSLDTSAKNKGGFWNGVLAAVCCFFIFLFLVTDASILTARFAVTPDNIEQISDSLDAKAAENILDEFAFVSTYESGEDESLLEEIFEESSIPDFVTEKVSEYGEYMLGGKRPEEVTRDDVVTLLERNSNVLRLLINGPKYSYSYVAPAKSDLEGFFNINIKPLLNILYDGHEVDVFFSVSRIVLSIWTVIGFALIVLLLAFLLIKTRIKKINSLNWLGYTCIASGAPFILALIAMFIVKLSLPWSFAGTKEILGILLESLGAEVLIIGASLVVSGVLMVVIRAIINKISKKRSSL